MVKGAQKREVRGSREMEEATVHIHLVRDLMMRKGLSNTVLKM